MTFISMSLKELCRKTTCRNYDTALVSALTDRAVKREVGMTGEITLRVLPIGGLKERRSARTERTTTIIAPKDNEKI